MASFLEALSVSSPMKSLIQDKTVLIIDDMPDARQTLRNMLSVCDLKKIKESGNATEAAKVLENHKIDIVLSDYNLGPGRDGQQLYEELMERRLVNESTIYLMITGERSYESVVRAAELAPDDYVLKPFTPAIIYSRIERAFIKKSSLLPVIERMLESKWEEAVAECDRQLTDTPKPKYPLELFRMKGECLLELNRLDDAQTLYEQILASYKLAWADYGIARIARKRGKLLLAATRLQHVVEDAPYFIKARDELAEVYEELGDLEKASQVLEKANEVSPNNVRRQKKLAKAAFLTGKLALAEKVLNNIVENCRFSISHDPSDYSLLSKAMSLQGKSEAAFEKLNEAVKFFGESSQTKVTKLAGQANLYFGANQRDKSFAAFSKAKDTYEKEEPELAEQVLMDLAEISVKHGDVEFCNRLLEKLPKGDAFSGLAQAKMIMAMFERAGRSDLAEGLVSAGKKEVLALNDQAVMSARNKNYDEALPIIRKAAQAVPDDLKVLGNMVKVLMAMVRDRGWSEALNTEILEGMDMVELISPDMEKELRGIYEKLLRSIKPGA